MMSETSDTPFAGHRSPLRAENPARYWPLVFFLFALHGAEEVLLDLPGWAREQHIDIPMISFGQGTFALLLIVLAIVVFAFAFVVRRDPKLMRLYLMVFLVTMALYFVVHLLVGIFTRSMEPGMITSIMFLPVSIWLFTRVRSAKPGPMVED